MKFGRFGREEGALLMVGRGGALSIKMLRRTVSFENKEARAGTIQGLRRRGQVPDRVWGGGGQVPDRV